MHSIKQNYHVLCLPILNVGIQFINKFCYTSIFFSIFRLYDVVKIGYALAMFLTYFLQFYVPMQILVPSFRRRFQLKYRNAMEYVFRAVLVLVTCVY